MRAQRTDDDKNDIDDDVDQVTCMHESQVISIHVILGYWPFLIACIGTCVLARRAHQLCRLRSSHGYSAIRWKNFRRESSDLDLFRQYAVHTDDERPRRLAALPREQLEMYFLRVSTANSNAVPAAPAVQQQRTEAAAACAGVRRLGWAGARHPQPWRSNQPGRPHTTGARQRQRGRLLRGGDDAADQHAAALSESDASKPSAHGVAGRDCESPVTVIPMGL